MKHIGLPKSTHNVHNMFPQNQRCELETVRPCLQGMAVPACRARLSLQSTAVVVCRLPDLSPTWWLHDITAFRPRVILCMQPSLELPLQALLHGADKSPVSGVCPPHYRTLPPSHLNGWKILGLCGGLQMPLPRTGTVGRERGPCHPARWQFTPGSREQAAKCDRHSWAPSWCWVSTAVSSTTSGATVQLCE